MTKNNFILAAKCPPEEKVLSMVQKAGLSAVELYLTGEMLDKLHSAVSVCKDFPFRYAVHAPTDGDKLGELTEFVKIIGAEIIVFHNIFWEDEWKGILEVLKGIKAKICIENTHTAHEPLKFMRRYGLGRCLDLEHLQLECAGVYEEEFVKVIKQASHIHLTGYRYGSKFWHTHIQHSPGHSVYMLNLLMKAGYSGFVVSEAKASLQTYGEFKRLNEFYIKWRNRISYNLK